MDITLRNSLGKLINRVCDFLMLLKYAQKAQEKYLSVKAASLWHIWEKKNHSDTHLGLKILVLWLPSYRTVACKCGEGKVFCCCCRGAPCLSGPNRRENVRIGEGRSNGMYTIEWWSAKCTPAQPSHWLIDVFVYVCLFIFLYIYMWMCLYVYETYVFSFPLTLCLQFPLFSSFVTTLFPSWRVIALKKLIGGIPNWLHWKT